MAKSSVKALQLRAIGSVNLTPSYEPINPLGFEKAPFFIRIVNSGTTPVSISFDGVTPNELVPVGQVFELNSQQNAQPDNWVCKWPIGTKVYVTGTAGTSGTITISGYYQEAS